MENKETVYKAYVFCDNCRFRKEIEVPKGLLISDVLCPSCGNLTLEDDPNGEIFSRPHKPVNYR